MKNDIKKDFLGQELNIGNKIAYIQSWSSSNSLQIAEIIGFTENFIKIRNGKISYRKAIRIDINQQAILYNNKLKKLKKNDTAAC